MYQSQYGFPYLRWSLQSGGDMNDDSHASHSCQGKKAYASRNEAKESLRAERRRFPKLAFDMYRCTVCHKWHIGHDRKFRNTNVNIKYKKQWRKHRKMI
jgi:hypothetical protein